MWAINGGALMETNGSWKPMLSLTARHLSHPSSRQLRESVEIAFVGENPSDWMHHCQIPEHMTAGIMSVIRVSWTTA